MLFYAFNAFKHIANVKYTLVIQQMYVDYWKQLCVDSNFNIPHNIVIGGSTRFHSVKAGLANIPNESLVLIHDSARPFPSKETISNVISICEIKGNAIPSINVTDTIREVTEALNLVVDRKRLKAIQTPQGFQTSLIKNAYNQSYNELFTDDANVLESTGYKINLVSGNVENIKITTPNDFVIAKALVENNLT